MICIGPMTIFFILAKIFGELTFSWWWLILIVIIDEAYINCAISYYNHNPDED